MVLRSPRILICRLSHVGDCILTMPLLNALRAAHPDAFLAWVVEPPSDQLLRNHDALDRLIVTPKGWLKSPKRFWRLRHDLRQFAFDVAIDPQSLTKSSVAAYLSGAKKRIGFRRGLGREMAPILNNRLVRPTTRHTLDRSLELLRELGIDKPRVEFRVPHDPAARAFAREFIRQAHLALGFAVINVGAGWHSRRWPAPRYASLARYLGQHQSLPCVVTWAGEQERQWASYVVARSGGHAILAPPTKLTELAELLCASKLFVGSDTGPLHLAVAVGTTSVGLHGTTRPEDSGAYGPGHVSVQAYYQSGSSRRRRRADNDAMRAIEVDAVCEACATALRTACHEVHHVA